ncbi:hypothetical protein RRG08_038756 [Elysia crispata]|uniref:Uncharacterized protein n=1 Tax=Elysia crispata TaxID=231223 RepID=A0AAE1ALJ7_9GAST|nr:hypothetical protein RRG08_038756 [Elysia crispata]
MRFFLIAQLVNMRGQSRSSSRWCRVQALMVLLCLGLSQSAILPNEICLACSAFFRTSGCIGNENGVCQMIAFKLLLQLEGQSLCDERPCTGYGQPDTHSCRGIFQCPLDRIDLLGICNGLDFCCRNS